MNNSNCSSKKFELCLVANSTECHIILKYWLHNLFSHGFCWPEIVVQNRISNIFHSSLSFYFKINYSEEPCAQYLHFISMTSRFDSRSKVSSMKCPMSGFSMRERYAATEKVIWRIIF